MVWAASSFDHDLEALKEAHLSSDLYLTVFGVYEIGNPMDVQMRASGKVSKSPNPPPFSPNTVFLTLPREISISRRASLLKLVLERN